jgi:hypothetical protein
MEYWIWYALGLTGLVAWWANKYRTKPGGSSSSEELVGKPKPSMLETSVKGPIESYTREDFLATMGSLHGSADYQALYEPKTSEYAVSTWEGKTTNPTGDRSALALAWRTAAHDGRLSDATRRLFERASRMMRFAAIAGDTVTPSATTAAIDGGFASIDAGASLGLPAGAYEGFDTVKDGTYTREKFLAVLDEVLAAPEVAAELKTADMATGIVVDKTAAVREAGVKVWDDGPTAARAAYAIDDYAAGRGVEPHPDATNTTVVWTKSGTATSDTDPFSPAVASKLIDLAMAMRWRAIAASSSPADAESTRAAIDEVFRRIDIAAA